MLHPFSKLFLRIPLYSLVIIFNAAFCIASPLLSWVGHAAAYASDPYSILLSISAVHMFFRVNARVQKCVLAPGDVST